MKQTTVNRVEKFVKDSFIGNPGYSFGDWRIMYEHSLKVKDMALQIAERVECDKEVLAIEAWLHDIGKVYKADQKILREHHTELGYDVAKDFLSELNLSEQQTRKLEAFLRGKTESLEGRIIKDADIIAFFLDEKLQKAFKSWADKQALLNEMQRKADKFNRLEFGISKEIARPLYEEVKKRWHLK